MTIEEKGKEVLFATIGMFMKYGIKSLTMDDITRNLGISKKTLYLYVKDKKELVFKGIQLMIDEEKNYILDITKNSHTAVDELMQMTVCISEKFGELHASVIYDLQKYHPNSWRLIEEHRENFIYDIILKNLKRGIAEGYYRKNLNPRVIAFVYISMLDKIISADNPLASSMSLEKLHLEIINYHIKGISNEKGAKYLKEAIKKEGNNNLSID